MTEIEISGYFMS